MNVRIEESWRKRLQEEFDKPYFAELVAFVKQEYRQAQVLPPGPLIFRVFNACPFEQVKVVILGQDPYPMPGLYDGVCFSVPEGVPIPGSLANIFQEIHNDLGKAIPTSGNLDRWVAQGVLSMNSVLTVRPPRVMEDVPTFTTTVPTWPMRPERDVIDPAPGPGRGA